MHINNKKVKVVEAQTGKSELGNYMYILENNIKGWNVDTSFEGNR